MCIGHFEPAPTKPKLPKDTIRCECGEHILVVPDVQAMQKAVKNHCRKCKAKSQSFPDAQYYILISKMVHLIAESTFTTTGGCAGYHKLGGS